MNEHAMEIPRPIVNQLLHYAQISPDAEVCGLIGAQNGKPRSCYPVCNAHGQPSMRFQLDPHGQIEAMRQMRERSEVLFAIFHSHPNTPALPSATDAAEAAYPEALYLIVSLSTKGVLEMRGFKMDERRTFVEVELQVR